MSEISTAKPTALQLEALKMIGGDDSPTCYRLAKSLQISESAARQRLIALWRKKLIHLPNGNIRGIRLTAQGKELIR